jgi:hypothetical protein
MLAAENPLAVGHDLREQLSRPPVLTEAERRVGEVVPTIGSRCSGPRIRE